jgi:large repetitive protein
VSDDRLDRELGDIFRAAANVELPGRLLDQVASIPARRPARLTPSLRTALPIGSLLVGGLVVLALIWGMPRLAPAANQSSATPVAGPSRLTVATSAAPKPCSISNPTVAPADGGPTPTPWPATPSPIAPAGPTPTPAPGSFARVGSMTSARYGATATLLKDGRVLIVGGMGAGGNLATAELYDPATCTFRATGSMPAPRAGYTATLLSDGRVLIAGGFDGFTSTLMSALLYDPGTGSFSTTGSMTLPRTNHSATLLPDGEVLIAGGEITSPGNTDNLASAELYDAITGTFRATGSMTATRNGEGVALLPDGRVLFAGGNDGSRYTGDLASAELYDAITGKFSPTGSMLAGWGESATVLQDGRVLVLGEIRNLPIGTLPTTRPSAELYDPTTGTFSMTGPFGAPIGLTWPWALKSTLLPEGHVLVLGGSSAQLYDPAAGTFAPTGSMTTLRSNPAVASLQDGSVLVTGGSQPQGDTPGPILASAELFQP